MADASPDFAEQVSRVIRSNDETLTFVIEQRKLMAEQAKLQAEAAKLLLNQDFSPWKIVAISVAMTAALMGSGAVFAKLLCR